MIPIELDELGPQVERPLTADQGRMLAASGVVTAVPSPYRPGMWLVGPAGKVGSARVGDIEVRIKPKIEIARLLFLLGYSAHAAAWQADAVSVGEAADLVPAVAQALWRQTEQAIHQGLLPGYVVVEESSQVLRGRLRESAQLHMHHGLPLPLEIRHDEFTTDIAENQILRTACERMLLVPRVDPESSRMLRRLLRDFTEVGSIPRGDPVPAWQPDRLNARYHTALRLAELVLRATSVEHEAGFVAVNGFLLDMPKLFEGFVTVALREAIEADHGGRVDDQVRSYLDQAGRVVLRPDIVWKVGGSAAAVIDAKYLDADHTALLDELGLPGPQANSPAEAAFSSRAAEYRRLCNRVDVFWAGRDRARADRTSADPVRSADARRAVLLRSEGRCENPSCTGDIRDLTDSGDPILEIDHIHDLAQGGPDNPVQMIALCPNCHAIKTRGRTREQLRGVLLVDAERRHNALMAGADQGASAALIARARHIMKEAGP